MFFIAILIFIVLGFQRGWRRELVSLVFVLLATVLINVKTSDTVGSFLSRIPIVFALIVGATPPESSTTSSLLGGPMWSLLIFAGIVVLGYMIGDRVFPKPATPTESFIGIIPGVISGAFILWYLNNFTTAVFGQSTVPLDVSLANPINYVPVIFVILILALVVALITARVKKGSGKK